MSAMSTYPLRRVPQRSWEKGDCGIACVAMITGKSYEVVLEAFKGLRMESSPSSFRTRHKEVEALLGRLDHKAERKRFQGWDKIPGHAIVKVDARKNGAWHWVVFDAGRGCPTVHDPKPGKRMLITDFRGLKGSGQYLYLPRDIT